MDCADLQTLIAKWELVGVEFKSKRMLDKLDSRDFAAALASLANRNGGFIVIGVDDESRQVEPGSIEDKDELAGTVANVARNLCSPTPQVSHDSVVCPDGEVFVLYVSRRTAVPVAVVERTGSEIRSRIYYTRNNQGKQLVSDTELGEMFRSVDFPVTRKSFPFAYAYDRRSLSSVHDSKFVSRALAELVFDVGLRRIVPAGLPDAKAVPRALAELFPYAVIEALCRSFSAGWGYEVTVAGFGVVARETGEPSRRISPGEIPPPPPNSYLSSLRDFTDFRRTVILFFQDLLMPPETLVEIAYDAESMPGSRLTIRSPGVYRLTVVYRGGSWSVGFPPGHPLDSHEEGPRILKADNPTAYALADVDLEFEVEFDSPELKGRADYRAWAERLFRILENEFSWLRYLDRLPDPMLRRIDHKLDLLLKSAWTNDNRGDGSR